MRWFAVLTFLGVIALFSVLTGSTPARAETRFAFANGNTLHGWCSASQERESTLWYSCWGYVLGVVDLAENARMPPAWCIPQVVSGQFNDAVAKWLDAHPEKRHLPGARVVILALHEAFPCSE